MVRDEILYCEQVRGGNGEFRYPRKRVARGMVSQETCGKEVSKGITERGIAAVTYCRAFAGSRTKEKYNTPFSDALD